MNWAVVMTGGKGTRFWPESRTHQPKPFLKLIGKQTLLEETVDRLKPFFPSERIVIVLQESLVKKARHLFPKIPARNFLGEPAGRNTAPCCVFAASQIARRDPDAKLVFLPADQIIRPHSLFIKTLKAAFQIVDDRPVLLGFKPHFPHTGYGYLELGGHGRKTGGISQLTVRRFHEKPGLAQAKMFLKKGNFLWNGGTFVWRADSFKKAVQKHAPKLYQKWNVLASVAPEKKHTHAMHKTYFALPSISIDYAVMEKMKNVHCLLAPFRWSDVGSWVGLSEFWPEDKQGNRTRGNILLLDSEKNIVQSRHRLIALLGVKEMVVVDTPDAILVCPVSKVEEIRRVVNALEKKREHHRYL